MSPGDYLDRGIDPDRVESPRTDGIDRRAALKKAAVGGAIAWSAPTVLASKAAAVEFIDGCTAKCFGRTIISIVNVCTFCTDIGDGLFTQSPGLTFLPSGECPCSEAPPDVGAVDGSGLLFQAVDSSGTPSGPVYPTVPIGGVAVVVGAPAGSYVSVQGSTAQAPVTCPDRGGRQAITTCRFEVAFTFSPTECTQAGCASSDSGSGSSTRVGCDFSCAT